MGGDRREGPAGGAGKGDGDATSGKTAGAPPGNGGKPATAEEDTTRPDDTWVLRGVDLDAPAAVAFAGGTAVVFTHRSPHRETANQDSAAALHFDGRSGVLAVADGAGGHAGGDRASGLAVAHLARALAKAREAERTLRDGILDAFESANLAIQTRTGGATTFLVVELIGTSVRVYHAGDSMALVFGQRGRLKHATVPHSPVGYAVEAGVLDADDAMSHHDRHVISNALGVESMHIEVGPLVELAPRDTLLLASDGLFDNLAVPEIVETTRKGPLREGVAELVRRSRERMAGQGGEGAPSKPDDLTILAWRPAPPRRRKRTAPPA